MNNKGFTLIELIVTIALLAVIALISTPNIIKIIEKNKVDNYNEVIDSIIDAAEIYASDNRYKLNFTSTCKPGDTHDVKATVMLGTLIDNKNLKSNKDSLEGKTIENPCTKEVISRNTNVEITLKCKTKQLSYEIIYDTNTNLQKNDSGGITLNGKIIDGKKCSNLYG